MSLEKEREIQGISFSNDVPEESPHVKSEKKTHVFLVESAQVLRFEYVVP